MTNLDGSPAMFTTIAVEDPFLRESRSVTTDAKGVASYDSEAHATSTGTHQFSFSSPDAVEPALAEVLVNGGDEFPRDEQGMLDMVFVIDKTGSMADDIAMVKQSSRLIIDALTKHCTENNISLQVGLVTYGDHVADAADGWLHAYPLTKDGAVIRALSSRLRSPVAETTRKICTPP